MTTIPNPLKDGKSGILLVNKPAGRTSFHLVHVLRKITGIQKIGHAGTLDPFATGVMVMLVGKSYTRLSDQFLCAHKKYIATVKIGTSTDTYDLDGTITFENNRIPTREEIDALLPKFNGEVIQTPPMFSAKKVGGQKLCDLARKGISIERKAVPVTMTTTILSYEYPNLVIEVACSKGTYIRSIAHDLGQLLGTGAHLTQLQRTQSGSFNLDACVDYDTLRDASFNYTSFLIHPTLPSN